MSVIEAVLSFDGKHVDDLNSAARNFAPSDGPVLIELCSSGESAHRVAATWIVKAVLETGGAAPLDLPAFFARLDVETDWEALLHLLQSVQHAPEAASARRAAVRNLLDHKKALVAVWALDAFVRIGLETGDGLEDARQRVETSLTYGKAAMRARARHLAPLLGL